MDEDEMVIQMMDNSNGLHILTNKGRVLQKDRFNNQPFWLDVTPEKELEIRVYSK